MSCGVGGRHSSDPALLWLWHRPAAIVLIRPLAWGPPYATGAVLKRQKTKKKKTVSWPTVYNNSKYLHSISYAPGIVLQSFTYNSFTPQNHSVTKAIFISFFSDDENEDIEK